MRMLLIAGSLFACGLAGVALANLLNAPTNFDTRCFLLRTDFSIDCEAVAFPLLLK